MKQTAIMVVAAGIMAGQSLAGYEITITSSTEGTPGGRRTQAQNNRSTVVMATDTDKARVVFKEGQGPGTADGGFLVTRDAGKTFYMVSPKEKTYMKWDMESMMGMAGAMGGVMQMRVSDPKVETLLDEAGEPILGYPTRHYKFRTAYRMAMNVMGFRNEMTTYKEEETWTTTALDVAALGAWLSRMPRTQNAELDKLVQAEMAKMRGMPLRTLSIQTTIDGQGKTNTTRSVMTVTEIRKIGAGEVDVEIPPDYRELSLFQPQDSEIDPTMPPTGRARKPTPAMDLNSIMRKAMESAE